MRNKLLLSIYLLNSIFIFFICSTILIPIQTKEIEVYFKHNDQSGIDLIPYTVVCLGSLFSQCFNVYLDFNTLYTFVVDYNNNGISVKNKFEYQQSKTFKMINNRIEWIYKAFICKGYQGKDQLVFGYHDLKDMMMIFEVITSQYCPNIEHDIDGVLGLGLINLKGNQGNFSFIQQLYEQSIIDNTVFYINHTNRNDCILNIGSIPDIEYTDYTHYGSCKNKPYKNEIFPSWRCSVKTTKYNPRYTEYTNDNVIFAYNKKYISPPYYLVESLWEMFYDQSYTHICRKVNLYNGNVIIKCNKDPGHYFDITLITDDWTIKIPIDNIVIDNDNEDVVLFFEYGNKNWVLGYNYLKHITVVFDIEKKRINFYHPKWVNYVGREELIQPTMPEKKAQENNRTINLVLIQGLMIILIAGTLFTIIIYIRKIDYIK